MKKILIPLFTVSLLFSCAKKEYLTISVDDYVDKMKAAWIGQMAGVGWGGPTEFNYHGEIIPTGQVPAWEDDMINCFGQDDLYVEMTFLKSLEKYGIGCGIIDAGIDFANSEYQLWGANREGRDNMRAGIAPPASSHPRFSHGADWIDYQIEADFSGIITPGMPNQAVKLGETFGRIMNYGDGLYAGQFVGAMYANAFFENDMEKIIEKSLLSIPYESQYAECMRDVVQWHREAPDDWRGTWKKIEDKYFDNQEYQKYLAAQPKYWSPMDAKLNGAFILMGMLYGNGDPDSTIVISMRCGRDSDCNPSNAAGVLFTTMGFSKLAPKYTKALASDKKFSYTDYSFDGLTEVCLKLAQDFVKKSGGRITTDENGKEVMLIPVKAPYVSEFVQSWEPKPFTGDSLFTTEQYARVKYYSGQSFARIFKSWDLFQDSGYEVDFAGKESETNFIAHKGHDKVMKTVAGSPEKNVVISTEMEVKPEQSLLSFQVSYEEGEQWHLQVQTNSSITVDEIISSETCPEGWKQITIDLGKPIGEKVDLQIMQINADGKKSTAYWSDFELSKK